MKKTIKISVQFILAATLIFTACKKKKDETPTPEPVIPIPAINPLTATINGTNYTTAVWYNNGIKDIYMVLTSNNSSSYSFSAFQKTNVSIGIKIPFGTGTYNIAQTGSVTAGYSGYYTQDTTTYWSAMNGTISITEFDTNGAGSNIFNKLKGTFSFSTTTQKGISHNITNGIIDYTKP
ncbi:MAG: hypothetical protein H0W73_11900 [Bacteroidetes bacterium]|nr:hypothetical protein [Bacteroidota bacterium]